MVTHLSGCENNNITDIVLDRQWTYTQSQHQKIVKGHLHCVHIVVLTHT